MMNRSRKLAVMSLLLVAVALVTSARSVAAQGTVITLADGVVVPGNDFVDLDPVNVDGFQQVSLLGSASSQGTSTVIIRVAFSTDPVSFGGPGSKMLAGSCGVLAVPSFGVSCGGSASFFPIGVAGSFLVVRVEVTDAFDRSITLKAYLR